MVDIKNEMVNISQRKNTNEIDDQEIKKLVDA